jgi:hypothetical protein
MRRITVLLAGLAFVASRDAGAQTCTEPHYRWSEKTDVSLASKTPISEDVSDILASWAARNIFRADKCAPRAGREKRVYEVTGWVRRIKKAESDHDWHIEITENEEDPVGQCVIMEIPSPDLATAYGTARDALTALLSTETPDSHGDFDHPVQVTFRGAAFFDGYHQKVLESGARKASGHGRCNASVRALWELHPIYKVSAPEQP